MSAASYNTISSWFDAGVDRGYEFMIVWCDQFDFSDYPSYYSSREDALAASKSPRAMQRLMESYLLRPEEKERQMSLYRCHALRDNQ